VVLTRQRSLAVLVVVLVALGGACSSAEPQAEPSASANALPSGGASTPEEPDVVPSTQGPPLSEAPSAAGPDPSIDEGRTDDGRLYLVAPLDAGSIADGAGDGSATGDFAAEAVPLEATVELCYELEVEDLSSVAMSAELRWDDPAGDDPVVAVLEVGDATDSWRVEDCVIVDGGSAVSLFQGPAEHYVVVLTQEHPDGAVRGQVREG
jgi:hypothetical protein